VKLLSCQEFLFSSSQIHISPITAFLVHYFVLFFKTLYFFSKTLFYVGNSSFLKNWDINVKCLQLNSFCFSKLFQFLKSLPIFFGFWQQNPFLCQGFQFFLKISRFQYHIFPIKAFLPHQNFNF